MPETTVQIPQSEWNEMKRLVKAASQYLRELTRKEEAARPQWVDARTFGEKANKNKEQLRYFREKHPELVKPKPGSNTHYLYNLAGYESMINR